MKKANPEWRRWERDVCSEFGFKEVVASGATDNYKGDCKGEKFLVDCKYTERKTYSLTFDMWEKVYGWGVNEGRDPMVAVRSGLGEFVVMDEPNFYSLTSNDTWRDGAKSQRSVSVGKQKCPEFYVLSDGTRRMPVVVSPIDDVRESIVAWETHNE